MPKPKVAYFCAAQWPVFTPPLTPLYRQAQIYIRQGVDLDRSTLADWVGRAAYELRPVHDALMADLKRSTKLFMDETRAPVLVPGTRKTKPDTSGRWPVTTDLGVAQLHQVLSSPMLPVGAGSMLNGYCRASAASCRSTAMPDTTD
jgi:hypothetical protein